MSQERIRSWCPACKSKDTVFVASGGYLTCSWVECPEPDFMKAWQTFVDSMIGDDEPEKAPSRIWNSGKNALRHQQREIAREIRP
jgi:hypothetical protein